MSAEARRSSLTIDSKTFSRPSVLRALYWLGDQCAGEITTAPNGDLDVVLIVRPDATLTEEAILAEFRTRLVDEELRAKIREETAAIRELILAKAFAAPGLLDDSVPGDDRDPVERDG